jgi:hypothetical protein
MAAGFLLVVVLSWAALRLQGPKAVLAAAGAVALIGLIAWAAKRRSVPIAYELGPGELILHRGEATEHLPLETVLDVNLIDRFTARDYGTEVRPAETGGSDKPSRHPVQLETRFCGVPVGLGRTGAIFSGLSQLNVRDFRRSLVLLRVRDGGAYLLSPKHGASMVSAITRQLAASKEAAR